MLSFANGLWKGKKPFLMTNMSVAVIRNTNFA